MAYYRASNVFSGLQQGESAPYEGPSSTLPAPPPWGDVLLPGEPDYSWCGASDNKVCSIPRRSVILEALPTRLIDLITVPSERFPIYHRVE